MSGNKDKTMVKKIKELDKKLNELRKDLKSFNRKANALFEEDLQSLDKLRSSIDVDNEENDDPKASGDESIYIKYENKLNEVYKKFKSETNRKDIKRL